MTKGKRLTATEAKIRSRQSAERLAREREAIRKKKAEADAANAEAVKKRAAELKVREEELRKLQTLASRQRGGLISAACNGEEEVQMLGDEACIYLPQELIESGIEIVEVGLVPLNRPNNRAELQARADEIRRKAKIRVAEFIDLTKNTIGENFYDYRHYREAVFGALSSALDCDSANFSEALACLDEIDDAEFKDSVDYKIYLSSFKELDELVTEHTELVLAEFDIDYYRLAEKTKWGFGEYRHLELEGGAPDVLEPFRSPKNFFLLKWVKSKEKLCLVDEIISANGLGWLSSMYGQNFLDDLNAIIESASESGKSEVNVDVFASRGSWWIKFNTERVNSCSPDGIAEILRVQGGFTVESFRMSKFDRLRVRWSNVL
jgi:hypothetical protein